MCLITDQLTPLLAEKDMTVYKALSYSMLSPYEWFEYELGKLYETKLGESQNKHSYDWEMTDAIIDKYGIDWKLNNKVIAIGPGFHSVLTPERLKEEINKLIVECTVPAGSQYYLDLSGCIVSNKIIINKVIEPRE